MLLIFLRFDGDDPLGELFFNGVIFSVPDPPSLGSLSSPINKHILSFTKQVE